MQRWNENEPPAVAPFEDLLPNEFTVNQNYPNPFNPATVISFNLPRAGNVILTIYNTLGQEVIKLHDGYLQAGPHQLVWKGECENGDFAASGIYYYQLDFNGDAKVMKMLLLK
jgi:hypothetical protein